LVALLAVMVEMLKEGLHLASHPLEEAAFE
jgi:hypothetical protein